VRRLTQACKLALAASEHEVVTGSVPTTCMGNQDMFGHTVGVAPLAHWCGILVRLVVVVAPLAHRLATDEFGCRGIMTLVVVAPLAHRFVTSGLDCF